MRVDGDVPTGTVFIKNILIASYGYVIKSIGETPGIFSVLHSERRFKQIIFLTFFFFD